MKYLVTGATGFVGKTLCDSLLNEDCEIVAPCRSPQLHAGNKRLKFKQIADLDSSINWQPFLFGVDVVVHLAARVHVMTDNTVDPLTEYRRVNVDGTLNLAHQAVKAGVKRFVYISTIKVNGEETTPGQPFTADDDPSPFDHYAVSKYEAEIGLQKLAASKGMEVVVVRPPLVYGPGVKANFLLMMRILKMGIPLPLGSVKNARSLVSLDNLVDLIITCTKHPKAANEIFLVSDGEDLSTTTLLRRLASALGKSAYLVPIPVSILYFSARLLGKLDVSKRLLGWLQVDISKSKELLGWMPKQTIEAGLRKTADHFLASSAK